MIKIMDFYGEFCGPCRVTGQNLDVVVKNHPEIIVEKIDAVENDELVEEYSIRSIPALIYFKDGVEVKRTTGLQTVQQIEGVLKEL